MVSIFVSDATSATTQAWKSIDCLSQVWSQLKFCLTSIFFFSSHKFTVSVLGDKYTNVSVSYCLPGDWHSASVSCFQQEIFLFPLRLITDSRVSWTPLATFRLRTSPPWRLTTAGGKWAHDSPCVCERRVGGHESTNRRRDEPARLMSHESLPRGGRLQLKERLRKDHLEVFINLISRAKQNLPYFVSERLFHKFIFME